MSVFSHIDFDHHEQVVYGHDKASGLRAIIAIHNSNLGPALGGCRMWPYANDDEALRDVLRLSRGMTYKSALANLPLGGGKAVIIGDPHTGKSAALFQAMGDFVDSLGGRYITAADSGTGVAEMQIMAERTRHVSGAVLREAWVKEPAVLWQALDDGNYTLAMQSLDKLGLLGQTAEHPFQVQATPAAPLYRQPAAGATVGGPSLTLRCTELLDASSYRIQVASDAAFGQPLVDVTTQDRCEHMAQLPPGRYHWRVASVASGTPARQGPFGLPSAFEVVATEAYGLTQGQGPEWEHACELGKELDPSNPLYQPGGSPATSSPDSFHRTRIASPRASILRTRAAATTSACAAVCSAGRRLAGTATR